MGWRHELDGRPLHYHGNLTIQKAVFFLCGIGWVAVIRLLWGVWQVKRPRQKLLLAGLAIILVVLIELTLPQFVPARVSSSRNACIANLKQIQGAKETWALENQKSPTDVPWPADLIGSDKHIRATPVCPAWGSYRLRAVGEKATCSVSGPGHTIESNRYQPNCMALTDFPTFQRIISLLQNEDGMDRYASLNKLRATSRASCSAR